MAFKQNRVLFSAEQIAQRLRVVSREIARDLSGAGQNQLIFVPILEGGGRVGANLKTFVRDLWPGNVEISERPIRIRRTAGMSLTPPVMKELEPDERIFMNRAVLIIDDLIDEGATLKLARDAISRLNPSVVKTFVVVKKRKKPVLDPDYFCFDLGYDSAEADGKWLFGYGLDLDGELRDSDQISEVTKD